MKRHSCAGWFIGLLLLACSVVTFADTKDKQQLRIVALAPHIVELLFEIGAGEQIIATTTYADYPPAAKSIPVVGNYARIQIERIIEMQPDLIIAWESGNPVDDLARLESYGFRVAYSQPHTLDDVAKDLVVFGQLTGRETLAGEKARQFKARLQTIRDTYAHRSSVTVFYELWPQPLRTIAGNAWPQQHLTACGAINPFAAAASDYPEVSLEHVISQAPQIIVQPKNSGQAADMATRWQRWSSIPAVQHQLIIQPDPDKLHRMSSQVLDELDELCLNIDRARKVYARLNEESR